MSSSLDRWPLGMKLIWQLTAILVLVLQGPLFFRSLAPPIPMQALNDYSQEWSSAMNYFAGQPIYLRMDESIRLHQVYQPKATDKLYLAYNAHPPGAVLLALPFVFPEQPGFASYRRSLFAWNMVALILFGLAIGLICWELQIRVSGWLVLPGLALLLLYNPFRMQMSLGQLNTVLLLLCTLIWWAERRNVPLLAGVLVGVAAAIKLFPGFLLLWLLLRRRWSDFAAAVVAGGALGLLTLALFGWQAYADYLQIVLPNISAFRPSWVNYSVTGFWFKLFVGSDTEAVAPLVYAPLLANLLVLVTLIPLVGGWAWQTWQAHTPPARDFAFGLALNTMLLASPLTWEHSLLLMTLPLFFLFRHANWTKLSFGMFLLCWVVWWPNPHDLKPLWSTWQLVPKLANPVLVLAWLSLPFYALLGMYFLQWQQLQLCRRRVDSSSQHSIAAAVNET